MEETEKRRLMLREPIEAVLGCLGGSVRVFSVVFEFWTGALWITTSDFRTMWRMCRMIQYAESVGGPVCDVSLGDCGDQLKHVVRKQRSRGMGPNTIDQIDNEIIILMTTYLGPHPHLALPHAVVWDEQEQMCTDILLPFAGSQTLAAWRPKEALKWPQPLECFEQVVGAINHLHASDVVHHDLDLSNVLVSHEEKINENKIVLVCHLEETPKAVDGRCVEKSKVVVDGCVEKPKAVVDGCVEKPKAVEGGCGVCPKLCVIDLGLAERTSCLDPELRHRGHWKSAAPEQDEDSKLPLTPAIDVFPLASIGYSILYSRWNETTPVQKFRDATANILEKMQDKSFVLSVANRHHPRPESTSDILNCILADCQVGPQWFSQLLEDCKNQDPAKRPTPKQILQTISINRHRTY